ncbi:MAG: LCP family protein [Cyanobacteria bacterium P01_H01_bin.15]
MTATRPKVRPPETRYASSSPKRRSSQSRKRRHQSWWGVKLLLALVAIASAGAGAWLAFAMSSTPLRQTELTADEAQVFSPEDSIASKTLQIPRLSRPVNILVLGTKVLTSDIGSPRGEELGYHALVDSFEGHSDSMLLMRFDPRQDNLSVLSIPRDTRVRVDDIGVTKINTANYVGGPAASAQAVSGLLNDLPVDRYIRVNVQGVEELVDALGGVELYVPKDMKYQDDSQHLYINLKEGQQHLDGEKAVQFLRFRHDNYGDIGRVQRQQTLIRAVKEQIFRPSIAIKLPKLLSVIQNNVDTNLSVEEMMALIGFAVQTDRDSVEMTMLPGDFSGNGRQSVSYWLPDEQGISRVLADKFSWGYADDDYRTAEDLRIYIEDSTGDEEAVQALVRELQRAGYGRIYAGQPQSKPLDKTRIVAQRGDRKGANGVQSVLGVGQTVVESTGNLSSDITIQLGQDWLGR